MDLESFTERTTLLDPSGNRVDQVIEHRTDPLTGAIASINAALGEKVKGFLGTADVALLEDLEQKSRAGCPFCSAAERGTRFVPEVVPEGQLRIGTAVAMPNLFSKCAFDAVVVLDPALHVLFPSRLTEAAFADALRTAAEVVRRARRSDASLIHHVVGMNFLLPGGSSVPHPHLQVHVRAAPYSALARTMRLAAEYRARTGRNFFTDLLEHERKAKARWLGRTGSVEWIAAWAPVHQREVWGVLPGTGSLAEASDDDLAGFAAGICRVVSAYEESGIHPFTLAFQSSPEPARGDGWAVHVKICSRPAFKQMYANYDTWFTPLFMGDDVHLEEPEAYAARMRARF